MVTVNAEVIGLGEVEVEEDIIAVKAALKFQGEISELSTFKDDDSLSDWSDKQIKALDAEMAFVKKALNLKPAQAKKLEGLTADELGDLSGSIVSAVLHYDSVEETDDPKK